MISSIDVFFYKKHFLIYVIHLRIPPQSQFLRPEHVLKFLILSDEETWNKNYPKIRLWVFNILLCTRERYQKFPKHKNC